MAEMVAALKDKVNYEIIGPRFRQSADASVHSSSVMRAVYHAGAKIRRYSAGAIACQRARGALMRRSATNGHPLHCCSHLLYGDCPWIGDYENVNVLGFYSPGFCKTVTSWNISGRRSQRPRAVKSECGPKAHDGHSMHFFRMRRSGQSCVLFLRPLNLRRGQRLRGERSGDSEDSVRCQRVLG